MKKNSKMFSSLAQRNVTKLDVTPEPKQKDAVAMDTATVKKVYGIGLSSNDFSTLN